MPTTTTSASTVAAVGQPDPLDPPVPPSKPSTPIAEAEVDAVVAVQVGAARAPIASPSARCERHRQRLEHRDVEPALAAGGGHLGADEAGADHDDPSGVAVEIGPQGEAVVERAQHVDAGELGLPGQRARRRRRWR